MSSRDSLRDALKAHQPKVGAPPGRGITCTCGEAFGGPFHSMEVTWNSFIHHQSGALKREGIKFAVPSISSTMVIIDIDGVLADNTKHLPLVPERGWDWFGSCVGEFARLPLWPEVATALHRQGFWVVLLTNRPCSQEADTEKWLLMQGVEYSQLVMWDDKMPQAGHKEKHLVKWLADKREIAFAVDDDPTHIAMYTAYGIPAIHVQSGYHDIPGFWDPQEPKGGEDAEMATA